MNLKHIFFGLLLIICSVSCANKTEVPEAMELTKKIVLGDTLAVKIPDFVSHPYYETAPFWSYDMTSFSFLTEMQSDQISLNQYFFNEDRWRVVKLNRKGPNQVFSEGAYSFINDSLFYYFPIVDSRVLKMNINGEVLANHTFSETRMDNYNSQNKAPSIGVVDNSIYFDLTEYKSLEDKQTFYNSKLIGKFNFEEEQFSKLVKYPKEYQGGTWSTNDSDRNSIFVDDKVYMNFSKSHYVYQFDLEGSLIKKSKIGVSDIKEAKGRSSDSFENAMRQVDNGYYDRIVYDPWRAVFYRIAVYFDTKQEIKNIEDLQAVAHTRTITILTFDKELNVLAKDDFSIESGISENFFFVSEQGLFMNTYLRESENEVFFRELRLTDIQSYISVK